uniref:Uncharacterized protein n=1 Tax=Tanacetum cinerariifolium TaxID=118510 RepID=A0A6L2KQV0_TANCI|nr:hypothetical protein [Tanacetum cinerariifolium]
MNIKTLGYMNRTKTFHGWLICNGWIMDLEWNLVTILNIFNGDVIYFKSYEWYKNLEESELKDEALNSKTIFEGSKGVDEESSENVRIHCSPNEEWEDFERANHIGAYDERWFDEHKLMGDDDDDIGDLEDYLIRKDPPYYVNEEEEERSKERICKLLVITCVKPPTCKSEKFEVVKNSFGPEEEYVAIKEYEYDIWVRTEENVSQVYQDIFQKKDE